MSVERLTKRDIRIADAMDVAPIEQAAPITPLHHVYNNDVATLKKEDLSAELDALLELSREAYEQSKAAAESVEDMMDENCQATAQATAAQQLNTAINAIDKVARLKMNLIKMKKADGDDEELPEGAVIMDRNELMKMLNEKPASSSKV